jgi:hypothetical protein
VQERGGVWLPGLLVAAGLAASNAEAGRLIEQGAIAIDESRVCRPQRRDQWRCGHSRCCCAAASGTFRVRCGSNRFEQTRTTSTVPEWVHMACNAPRRVEKPWGHELIWAETELYVGKMLHVKAGHALSLQYHERKDETIHLLRGRCGSRRSVSRRAGGHGYA